MVQRHIAFTLHIHPSHIHSLWGGRHFYITGSSYPCSFFFRFGGGRPLHKVQSAILHILLEALGIRFMFLRP
jgi:hypothetical protein